MAASCNHVGVIRSGGVCRYGMVLVIEKRIPCGLCREEDSPITIWKEGFKRKGAKQTLGSEQFSSRCEPCAFFTDSLAVTSG